jgi:hypothetical protein
MQSKSSFDLSKPLLNVNAFENANSFNFYYGKDPRVSNLRGSGYHNHDVGLIKNTMVKERVAIQFHAEFFNMYNWHAFVCPQGRYGGLSFNTVFPARVFGRWNGKSIKDVIGAAGTGPRVRVLRTRSVPAL